ncbi:MAG: SoxR reducing system RseC family protein [Bacteroidales bacterium]|nr:SoxR reducing system RseC family protein [Bacteroidales bacterium]
MSEISHKGKIVGITPEYTTVEIVSSSACSACHAKGLCGVSESETKAVQLPTVGWDNFNVGDEVELVLSSSLGHRAVWLSYVIPLGVLLAIMLPLLAFGVRDIVAALAALGGTALYYGVLWAVRDKLQKEYVFNIRK